MGYIHCVLIDVALLVFKFIGIEAKKKMKKQPMLRLVSRLAEHAIKKANNTHCMYWSYQPKAPAGIKDFRR